MEKYIINKQFNSKKEREDYVNELEEYFVICLVNLAKNGIGIESIWMAPREVDY